MGPAPDRSAPLRSARPKREKNFRNFGNPGNQSASLFVLRLRRRRRPPDLGLATVSPAASAPPLFSMMRTERPTPGRFFYGLLGAGRSLVAWRPVLPVIAMVCRAEVVVAPALLVEILPVARRWSRARAVTPARRSVRCSATAEQKKSASKAGGGHPPIVCHGQRLSWAGSDSGTRPGKTRSKVNRP